MKTIRICVTGHRPDKLWGYDLNHTGYRNMRNFFLETINKALESVDHLELHSGMALGADTVWVEAIVHAKQQNPYRIRFVADITDMRQPSRWPAHSRKQWQELIDYADEVREYAEPDKTYGQILQLRNIGMIDASDIVIAIYDGSATGGTKNAVTYAEKVGKKVVFRKPTELLPS